MCTHSKVQVLMVDMISGFAYVLCEDGVQGYIQVRREAFFLSTF